MARDKPKLCLYISEGYHYEPAHEGISLSFAFPSDRVEKNSPTATTTRQPMFDL